MTYPKTGLFRGPGGCAQGVLLSGASALWLLTSVLAAHAAPGPVGPPPPGSRVELTRHQIKPGLFVLVGAGGNTVVRLGKGESIVVDAKYQGDNVAEALKAQLAALKAGPVRYLVLTHYHADHSGNAGMFQAAGATVVAQAAVQHLILTGGAVSGHTRRPPEPTLFYDDSRELRIRGARAQLLHYGPGHTAGDTIVYFPDLKVVAMGDLVVDVITPNIDYKGGGSALGLQRVLHQAAKLDFTECIPGHRDAVMSRAEFEDYMRRWDLFIRRARVLVKAGTPKAQFFAKLKSDDLKFDFTTFGWPQRVDNLYAELSK